ncbi:MAG: 2-oxoacid:acceptor oxidoreductase subunit alpha [Desulfobacterales bacterium]|nr:2-oxoacid:acceptor oxidoreductase subunit alpha [Desulfobacterales bacterium]
MKIDISIKIGGEAGQGIQTVGQLLALVCQAGMYVMAVNDFESRIRGGRSFFQVRISDRPVQAPDHRIHLLVAMDDKTVQTHAAEMVPGGIILMEKGAGPNKKAVSVPFIELAKQAGARITSNTVAVGACLALLGAPFSIMKRILSEQFSQKSRDILEKNIKAAELGFGAVKGTSFKWAFSWKKTRPRGILMEGSKAVALGAMAGDCRVGAFYPMSPATSIMAHLASFAGQCPVVVEQAEDEIAAVNMVIGAAFAGARAMTATSGGGFSLMVEGLGLAAITETPIVIVNAQRPGPATGLPTRTAQADLHFVIRASQDEFPRFVFAPGTPEEAYDMTARAFNLSEKYQVPAIVLVDQYFNDSLFTIEKPLAAPRNIERSIVGDKDMKDPGAYQRFAITPSGVSPRALPCKGKALVVVSSDEHREDGHISETISDRVRMVDKRQAKWPAMLSEMRPPQGYHGDSDILLIGWGSTKGAIQEAVDGLREKGLDAGSLHFTDLWPFPDSAVKTALQKKKKIIMVEQNTTAQLGQLIRQQTGLDFSGAILKYDGRPFYPKEIIEGVQKKM